MNAHWRILVAASAALLGAGTPALAQDSAQESGQDSAQDSAGPAQNAVVGPPQLQDFSLNGTVTREAPASAEVQTRQRQSTATESTATRPQAGTPRPALPQRKSADAAAGAESSLRQTPERSASAATTTDDLPQPTRERVIASPSVDPSDELSVAPQPAFIPAPADPNLAPARNEVPVLPWIVAALALVGAAAWYFLRQRPRESYAGASALAFEAPSPASSPVPPPVRKSPPAVPAKPASTGIVSTRLRPWIELEFTPQRGVVDDQKAAVAFELSVLNSGSVPAREVLLEASLFNGGPMQDQQIKLFFDHPVAKGDRIAVIPPLQRVTVNTAVFLARDQLRPIEIEGRTLFVPMIAFNALYRWGGGEGQTSASYLVGKTTKGEKLAPFRLDAGPRVFRNLAAREHELRLRN